MTANITTYQAIIQIHLFTFQTMNFIPFTDYKKEANNKSIVIGEKMDQNLHNGDNQYNWILFV
jgi:hypothetical protein